MRGNFLRAAVCAALSVLPVLYAQSLPSERLDELMIEPYRSFLVKSSVGLRSIRVLSATELEIQVGMSCAYAFRDPAAWIVTSFRDPFYRIENAVNPLSLSISRRLEANGFHNSVLPDFFVTVIRMTLPAPMRTGFEYSVTAIGENAIPITAGRASLSVVFGESVPWSEIPAFQSALAPRVLGLRGIASVGNGILQVGFGPAINFSNIVRQDCYRFTRNGNPINPMMISKRQVVETFITAIPYVPVLRTDVFFLLAFPLHDGDTITLEADPALCSANTRAELHFRADASVSPSFAPAQFEYVADSPDKFVFVANWIGILPGIMGGVPQMPPFLPDSVWTCLNFIPMPVFSLYRLGSSVPLLRAPLKRLRNPALLAGPVQISFPNENVFVADISSVSRPGWYFLSIPGVGRSIPFRIVENTDLNPAILPSHRFLNALENMSDSAFLRALSNGLSSGPAAPKLPPYLTFESVVPHALPPVIPHAPWYDGLWEDNCFVSESDRAPVHNPFRSYADRLTYEGFLPCRRKTPRPANPWYTELWRNPPGLSLEPGPVRLDGNLLNSPWQYAD